MGSKSRIAKEIVPIIQNYVDNSLNKTYVEPFVGGANVIDKIVAQHRYGYDINKYLISLFKYIQSNGELPNQVTKEEYSKVRAFFNSNSSESIYPDWYIGCVGFLASYNGRFFDGGYSGIVHTKANTIRNYYDEAKRNLLSQASYIEQIEFNSLDYRKQNFFDCVVYCDPPYEGVKQYGNSKDFNYKEFWNVMREWSKNNIVLISEHNAPEDFECIWQQDILRTVDNTKRVKSTEKLFIKLN